MAASLRFSVAVTISLFAQASGGVVHGHGRPLAAGTKGAFMQHRRHSGEELRDDLRMAFSMALGNRNGVEQEHMDALKVKMLPTWKSLAKNPFGNIDKKSFRYAVHRHFEQEHHLSIVGLEPAQVSNANGEIALLSDFAPQYVRTVLNEGSSDEGYSFNDLVAMVSAIQQLLGNSNHDMLEEAFNFTGLESNETMTREFLEGVLEVFASLWMLGEAHSNDGESDLSDLHEDWEEIVEFTEGQLKAFEYARRHGSKPKEGGVWNPLHKRYSFADAEEIVTSMTMSFGRFWETECRRIKGLLTDMDHRNSGRVPLRDFYYAATQGEWRFSESQEYLRQLGALDESSSWSGPQLILTNYIQGFSNCMVTAEHYRICCSNECEGILDEIEMAVGGPLGTPEQILEVLSNFTSFEDERARIPGKMRKQLRQIADGNGGQIPLHGRLFSQWLHYVFPHECPFPHKSGTTVAMTPSEFGESHVASVAEMSEVVNSGRMQSDEENSYDRMSQWSHEEEHLSDHTRMQVQGSTPSSLVIVCFVIVVAVAVTFGWNGVDKGGLTSKPSASFKAHAV